MRLGLFVFLCHSIQASGKVLQYSVFLSEYGRQAIGRAFLLSALVVGAVSLGFAGLVRQVRRQRLVAGTLAAVAVFLVVWRLFLQRVSWSGFAVYLIVEAASLLSVVVAWNVVNSLCDPRQARRVIPVVGLGASGAYLVNGVVISPLVHGGLHPRDVVWFVVTAAVGAAVFYRAVGLDVDASDGRLVDAVGRSEGGFLSGVGYGLKNLWAVDLLRVFTLATVLMIVAQQFLNFAFLSDLQSRYNARELASFLGWFVASLGVAQGLAQGLVSGRVLSKMGGASAAAMVPGLLAVGGVLYVVLFPVFWALVGLRFMDRLFKVAFYSPAVQSLYTPVARQTKLAAMTLIKGVVSPVAYGTAAFALVLFADRLDSANVVSMVAVSAGACALWFGLRGKRAYVSALESALARGALSLDTAGAEGFHVAADKTMIEACRRAVREGGERQGVFALRLLSDMPPALMRPVLQDAFSSPHVLLRRQAAGLLLEQDALFFDGLSGRLLADADGEVVSVGLRLLTEMGTGLDAAREKLSDARPLVRACAALLLLDDSRHRGSEGGHPGGVEDSTSEDVVSAGRRTLEVLCRSAVVGDRLDLSRAMALMETGVASDLLASLLADESWTVRAEAAQAVGKLGCGNLAGPLVEALLDRRSRAEAVEALGRLGPEVFVPIEVVVHNPDSPHEQVEAVIAVLAARPEEEAREILWRLMRHPSSPVRIRAARALLRRDGRPRTEELESLILAEVREGFVQAGIRRGIEDQGLAPRVFLQELEHQMRQTSRKVVAMTSLFLERDAAERIWSNMERGSARHRAGAVELIDQLCPKSLAPAVVSLLDGIEPPFPADLPDALVTAFEQARSRPFETACRVSSVELKWFLCYELPDKVGCCKDVPGSEGKGHMRSLIEKMLFFKGVGMFAELSGEELRRVAQISEEVSLPSGRTIFRRGDPGDAMYLVLDGTVRIVVDGRTVAQLGSGECFGEMALLDAEPRSADARSGTDVELLKIRGEDFDELLAQKHEIARGILRVLTARLRRANIDLGRAVGDDEEQEIPTGL